MFIKLTMGVTLFIAVCMVLTASMVIPIMPVSTGAQAIYFVSPTGNDTTGIGSIGRPWKTIEKAKSVVSTINSKMTGDIYVYLRGGTYNLSDTIYFNESDSGTNGYNVIYRNYPSEVPIISGGKRITGWTLYDSGKNIFKASAGTQQFRELYVNGTRAIRARYPNKDSDVTMGSYIQYGTWSSTAPYTFTVPNDVDGVTNWSNMSQIEVVMVDAWTQKHMRMSSYTLNGSDAIINFQSPENSDPIAINFPQGNTPHFYENSYDFLDAEGEWYLDTTTSPEYLYYIPRAGENMSTAEVE
jgi:hypothetical protein